MVDQGWYWDGWSYPLCLVQWVRFCCDCSKLKQLAIYKYDFRTKLDADSKKWRFFADVLNDCALTLELCAPYAVAAVGGSSGIMTTILCCSGAAKSIVGVAGGATRAALTHHQV